MSANICFFTPPNKPYDSINIINCVFESSCPAESELYSLPTFRLHYILDGSGNYKSRTDTIPLKKGDVLLTAPASPMALENCGGLEYIYISFIGTKANRITEEMRLSGGKMIINGLFELEGLWRSATEIDERFVSIRSEAVLLYTLSVMASRLFTEAEERKSDSIVNRMRKYIDGNLFDPSLSLHSIGTALGYNPKYLSQTFKHQLGTGVSKYITTLRIQYACTLINGGSTSVKDISYMSGFSDPLYFSTVFKKNMGITPSEYIQNSNKSERSGHNYEKL